MKTNELRFTDHTNRTDKNTFLDPALIREFPGDRFLDGFHNVSSVSETRLVRIAALA
jgi:hypothetical protein